MIEALAEASDTSPGGIEAAIRDFERSRTNRKSRPQKTVQSILTGLNTSTKETSDLLSKAASMFGSKVLFPNRRDVIAFLRKHGLNSHAKSRQQALPQLLRVLSALDEPQLRELVDTALPSGESDYSLLANQIMGKDAKKPR